MGVKLTIEADSPRDVHEILNFNDLVQAKIDLSLASAAIQALAHTPSGNTRTDAIAVITTMGQRGLPPVPPSAYPSAHNYYTPYQQTLLPPPVYEPAPQVTYPSAESTPATVSTPQIEQVEEEITELQVTPVATQIERSTQVQEPEGGRISGFLVLLLLVIGGAAIGVFLKNPVAFGGLLNSFPKPLAAPVETPAASPVPVVTQDGILPAPPPP